MSPDAILQVEGLSKTYGSGEKAVTAIGDLTFEVVRGEFLVIVGPSGCGKTTLLQVPVRPARADVRRGAPRREGASSGRRAELALVFQDYSRSLLPVAERSRERAAAAEGERRRKHERSERAPRRSRRSASAGFDDALSVAAVGRHAAARGDRPRAGLPAADSC